MPIALDPAQTVPFSLATDRSVPEHIRPRFLLRYLTCRQTNQLTSLVSRAADPNVSAEDQHTALRRAMALLIAGWGHLKDKSGQPIAYQLGGPDSDELEVFDDVLTLEEMWELVLDGRRETRLAERDKKKSLSQPASAIDASAPTADRAA
jgi:ribosome biogenesis protein Tsr3